MITMGENSYMGTVADNWNGDIHIGKFNSIANGFTPLGTRCEYPTRERPELVPIYSFREKFNVRGFFDRYPSCNSLPIYRGNGVWIGENVTIVDGVTIGDGVIIDIGSVEKQIYAR